MGRWDDGSGGFRGGLGGWVGKKGRNYVRIARFVIFGGFVVVAVVVLSVFLTKSGLNIEINEQAMGGVQTISVRVSNNNFYALNGIIVQFGDGGKIQRIGNMGPFSSVMVTPDLQDLNFNKITAKTTDGSVEVIKYRK